MDPSVSNEILNFLLSQSTIAVAMCDRQLQYLHTSQRWNALYGLTAADQHLQPSQLFGSQPELFEPVLQQCLAGKRNQGKNGQFIQSDGQIVFLQWQMQPWQTPTGEVGGILCTVEELALPDPPTTPKTVPAPIDSQHPLNSLNRQSSKKAPIDQLAWLLRRIIATIHTNPDQPHLIQATVNHVGQTFGASRCLIHFYGEEPTAQVPIAAEYVAPGYLPILGLEIPVKGNPYVQHLLAADWAIASDDVYADPLLAKMEALWYRIRLKSMLAVRIACQDKPKGLLVLQQCDHYRHWTADEIEQIEEVAGLLGIAFFQTHLLEQQTEWQEQLASLQKSQQRLRSLANREALLNRLSSQIRQSLDFDTILGITVAEIRHLLRIDRCQFVWYRIRGDLAYYEAVKESRHPKLSGHLGNHTFDASVASSDGLLARQVLRLDDCHEMTNPEMRQFFLHQNYRAVLSLPIQARSGEIGFIRCAHSSVRHWRDEEVELLLAVGNQLTIAIDQAELYKQTRTAATTAQAQARRQELLTRLVSQIRASLDLKTILQTVVNEIQALLHPDRCMFVWCQVQQEPTYAEVVYEAKHPELPPLMGTQFPLESLGTTATELLNKCIVRVDDRQDAENQSGFIDGSYRSLLALPIQTHSGAIGVISCSHIWEPRRWIDSEVELLSSVANQLAIAINQAELYHQMQTAAEVATAKSQELERTVQELQRAQIQLIQSEKMSSLGQMVAGVAHEINNPVSFIYGNIQHASNYIQDLLGMLELYRQHYPEPAAIIQQKSEALDVDFLVEDLPKLMQSMDLGATRIRDIVRSLRLFSRLDEAELKPVSLHEGIDSTLLILEHRLKASSKRPAIQVIRDYGSLPLVECYAGQLNQVFMNLLANAIDALEDRLAQNPSPGYIPTIRIHTELSGRLFSGDPLEALATNDNSSNRATYDLRSNMPKAIAAETEFPSYPASLPTPSVVIRIADNATGIPDEVLPKLFDPFFTTKPIGSGTGMGLAISYQIVVERHRGQLHCHSQVGVGTEFVVEIPLQRSPTEVKLLQMP